MTKPLLVLGTCAVLAASGYALTATDWLAPAYGPDVQETSFVAHSEAPSSARQPEPTEQARDFVQQRMGTFCETPAGACTVDPQPINSLCKCGESYGRIVR
ncbi:MAG TPA: hypothetical protein VIN05_01890 [Roseovarius sp.]